MTLALPVDPMDPAYAGLVMRQWPKARGIDLGPPAREPMRLISNAAVDPITRWERDDM